jgi:zeta-carotene desaturase
MIHPPSRVVIIGGGLAGMAAAIALDSAGCQVTLLEARKTLGGRAGSFEDPQTGEQLDNCQHVLLGCCTNLIDFYRRIGALNQIRFERTIHFRDGAGRRHDLFGIDGVAAPLNLGPSLLNFNALTWTERFHLTKAMLAMLRLGRHGRERLADVPFGDWLDEHGQPASLVQKFYDPVVVSGLNEETRRASAKYAIQIFQDAMLANERGYVMGLPTGTLVDLYGRFPARLVRPATRVSEILFGSNRAFGVRLQSGETLFADAVVVATNHHTLPRLIPPGLMAIDSRFARLSELESVPILGAHLFFDRPVLRESHAALIDGPLQWLFRKDAEGRGVHGVISAARDWVGRDKDECLKQFEQQVRGTVPAAREAKLLRGVIVIEKRATFSAVPGSDAFRPAQAPPPGGIEKLYLAGDYTQTGWPATMEGAVRSGYRAAEAISGRRFQAPDLPSDWPARFLGL